MSGPRVGINKRVADRLFDDGVIDESDFVRAVDWAKRRNARVEEAFIELDIVREEQLLKFIATMHKTQFVSTERMSKAKIDEQALRTVPKGMARHFGVYPLLLDRMNDKLIIATADPDNPQMIQELKVAARVERVQAMVARPEAVQAAIDRGYQGDRSRFKKLLQARVTDLERMLMDDPLPAEVRRRSERRQTGQPDWAGALSPNEVRRRMDDRPATGEYAPPRRRTGELDSEIPAPRRRVDEPPELRDEDLGLDLPGMSPGRYAHNPQPRYVPARPGSDRGRPDEDDPYARRPYRAPYEGGRGGAGPTPLPVPPAHDDALLDDDYLYDEPSTADRGSYPEQRGSYPEQRGSYPGQPPARRSSAGEPEPPRPPPQGRLGHTRSSMFPRAALGFGPMEREAAPAPESVFITPQYMESLRVLVGLLENDREDLRGHSAFVARLALNIAERISLPEDQKNAVVLASYLHDLGKMGSLHLTALNVAQSEEHLDLAFKLVKLPQQLTESVGFPPAVVNALNRMYERMGGGGIPEGLTGKDIPIEARILSCADSYADLTRNPSNEYGRMLLPDEAMDVLRQQAGMVFDENIIDVLERATSGEQILTDLLANRHRVLIADPDPESTMVLQLRLVEQGFDVHVARTTEEAYKAMRDREFALVVSEIDLDQAEAGFALRQHALSLNQQMSWVFVSSREDRDTAARALKLGIDDFIAKPVATEVLVAKLMQLVERSSKRVAPRGVSGSLAQMGIPEIVQILWHGRKTCALNLKQGDMGGQIHFLEGRIVNAIWGDARGETAFYRLLTLGEEGQFAVDPEFTPSETLIEVSPEGLLLEGMRLLDEGKVP